MGKEVGAVKDMAIDLSSRLTSLLNPSVWQSQERLLAELGSIFTGFAGGRIKNMLKELYERKDIDEKILDSEKGKQSFIDLIRFVTQENPDVDTWESAKRIFVRTLEKDTKEQERASLYNLLSICKELSGPEIKIISGSYKIYQKVENNEYKEGEQHHNIGRWASEVAQLIGFETNEEVLRYEDNLIKQKLISPVEQLRGDAQVTFSAGGCRTHRLTPLGLKLSKSFIS